jgi:hypothetical protein
MQQPPTTPGLRAHLRRCRAAAAREHQTRHLLLVCLRCEDAYLYRPLGDGRAEWCLLAAPAIWPAILAHGWQPVRVRACCRCHPTLAHTTVETQEPRS